MSGRERATAPEAFPGAARRTSVKRKSHRSAGRVPKRTAAVGAALAAPGVQPTGGSMPSSSTARHRRSPPDPARPDTTSPVALSKEKAWLAAASSHA